MGMSAELATPRPASTSPGSIFDDDWKSFGGDDQNQFEDLDDMSLDEILGLPPKVESAPETVDPWLLNRATSTKRRLSKTFSPQDYEEDNIFVGPATKIQKIDHPAGASSPYFNISIEAPYPPQTTYSTFPLHTQLHRRSVSEPPIGLPYEHLHGYTTPTIPEPPLTFTRSGLNIGTPKLQHGNRTTRSRHQHSQEPIHTAKPFAQERYHLRRTQTQPVRYGPTSVPPMRPWHHTPSPQMMMRPQYHPATVQGAKVLSRVCTPAPSPPQQHGNLQHIDPNLMSVLTAEEKKTAVTISLTVEELRVMITEAVRAALSGVGVKNSVDEVDALDCESEDVKEEED